MISFKKSPSQYTGDQKKLYDILKGAGEKVKVSNIYDTAGGGTQVCIHIEHKNTDLSCDTDNMLCAGYTIKGFRGDDNHMVMWLRKFMA